MPRLSILDLEQRIDPQGELKKLLTILKENKYQDYNKSFTFVINRNFNLLPFVGTSTTFDEFFRDREIKLSSLQYHGFSDVEATQSLLYVISFYLTYSSWIQSDEYNRKLLFRYMDESKRIAYYLPFIKEVKNLITSMLTLLNYQIIYEEEDNQYGFKTPLIVKRDTDVDSVLPLVDSDIRIDLLSYLDFRVENNLQAKQSILVRLYKTIIDDGKDKYSIKSEDPKLKYQNELYRKISQLYNQTDIRHGGEKIELTDEEKHKYYDMCFYLLLQLIRTPKSIEDMDEIGQKFNPKQKVNP